MNSLIQCRHDTGIVGLFVSMPAEALVGSMTAVVNESIPKLTVNVLTHRES